MQLFRTQLIPHKKIRTVFTKSLAFARQTGYLKRKKIKVALDTSNVLGRVAVKDTYNLHADADHLPEVARQARQDMAPDAEERTRLSEAPALLGQLLLQDVTRTAEGAAITQGVAADRVASVEDLEMRHGRKSARKRFDGHKVAVDPESQLITAAKALPGNAPDNTDALALVAEREENAQVVVEESIADCAYGDGAIRQAFANADRALIAKMPDRPDSPYFVKEDFTIDPVAQTCTCPDGQTGKMLVVVKSFTDRQGHRQTL